MPRKYTYGPFQSRRLKLSLGVDVLTRQKKCTYNCTYCELGHTGGDQLVSPNFRIQNKPTSEFRKELLSILKHVPHLNSITFGYNGEPTLNENLLDFLNIARQVRDELNWTNELPKLTLFTNSSTLHFEDIRERVKNFELVLAKLDSATDQDFKRTNAPHKEVPPIDTIIDSITELRKIMPKGNKLAIQCLICNSYREDYVPNDNPENINAIAQALRKIKPDIVQIYSIARIPAQYYVFAIDEERKREIVQIFNDTINDDSVQVNHY